MTKTYSQAREQIMLALSEKGYDVRTRSQNAPWADLKVPYATSPCGRVRLWFKSQSVWVSHTSGLRGQSHDLHSAHSTNVDIRDQDTHGVLYVLEGYAARFERRF